MELSRELSYPSIESIRAQIESTREKNQHLAITSTKISKWSRGRSYCVQGEYLFIIHTNFPNLNYLNLEEYSFYHFGQESICSKFFSEDGLKQDPLPLDYSGEHAENYLSIRPRFSNIVREQSETLTYLMEEEYTYTAVMSLLQQWDARKFQRLLDYRLEYHFTDFLAHSTCELYLGLIMACRADSYSVVDCFRKICTCFQDDCGGRFFARLPSVHIHFFARHLKTTDNLSTMQEPWLGREDLLITGCVRRDAELVKLALEMNCPSSFLPSSVSEDHPPLPAEDCWPRKKNGINPRSFNSSEYYAAFTDVLVFITVLGGLSLELKHCFHLIWRAFPVPYLPIEDMKKCMNRLNAEFADGEVSPGQEEWQPQNEMAWKLIETYFKQDFPH